MDPMLIILAVAGTLIAGLGWRKLDSIDHRMEKMEEAVITAKTEAVTANAQIVLMGDNIKEAKKDADTSLMRATAIEILVAGKYPTRAEMDKSFTELFDLLREIQKDLRHGLAGKVDKP